MPTFRFLALAVAAAAAIPLASAPAAFAEACGVSFDDPSGLEWDIHGWDARVMDGERDAYNDMAVPMLNTNGGAEHHQYENPNSDGCTFEDGGREMAWPAHTNVGGLGVNLSRKVYVPPVGTSFARWLDIIENPTGEAKTITYEWFGHYGIVRGVTATQSGDTIVDVGEAWASFRQDGDGIDTDFASLWDGPGGDGWDRPRNGHEGSVPGDDEENFVGYLYDDVTIPAGGTVILMHVEHQNPTADGARQFALDNGAGNPEFFAGMSDDEVRVLHNWRFDSDGDSVVEPDDNCTQTANPDQADLDDDGLGDACDDDVDGDGLGNAVEEQMTTDPRDTDSDGDGSPDGVDQCPTRAGDENGCPPLAVAAAPPAQTEPPTATPAPAPPALAPAVILPRLTPNRLTLKVRRSRPARDSLRLRSSGRILLPAGVSAAEGCSAGAVIVVVKSGANTVSTRVADLQPDCTYRSKVTFTVPRRLGRRTLRVRALFTGSSRLFRRSSSRVSAGRP